MFIDWTIYFSRLLALLTSPAAIHAQAMPDVLSEFTSVLTDADFRARSGFVVSARCSPLNQVCVDLIAALRRPADRGFDINEKLLRYEDT